LVLIDNQNQISFEKFLIICQKLTYQKQNQVPAILKHSFFSECQDTLLSALLQAIFCWKIFDVFYQPKDKRSVSGIEPLTIESLRSNSQLSTVPLGYSNP